MNYLAATATIKNSKGAERQWTWLSCPRCAGVVSIETDPRFLREISAVPVEDGAILLVKHLPPEVEKPYLNAITVLNAGVPSSAAVELRRTLEAAAQAHDVTVKPLVRAITELADQGLITKNFVDVLGHIRKIGNMGAHASDQEVSNEEASIALRFTTQVLRNLFEVPTELQQLGTPPVAEASEAAN